MSLNPDNTTAATNGTTNPPASEDANGNIGDGELLSPFLFDYINKSLVELTKKLQTLFDGNVLEEGRYFFKTGKEHGEKFTYQTGERAISGWFNAIAALAPLYKKSVNYELDKYKAHAEALEAEITLLEADLTEHEGSRIFVLKKELKELKEQRQKIIDDERIVSDDNFLLQLRKLLMDKYNALGTIVNAYTETIKAKLTQKREEKKAKEAATEEEEKDVKNLVEVSEKIENDIETIIKNFSAIEDEIKYNATEIPNPWVLVFHMAAAGIIIFGELYLVRNIVAENLGFDSTESFERAVLTYLFCIAYPLALGMVFKQLLDAREKDTKVNRIVRRFIYSFIVLLVLALSSISYISAEAIINLNNGVGNKWLLTIFLFSLTITFPGIAGILLAKVFRQLNKVHIFKKGELFRRKDASQRKIYADELKSVEAEIAQKQSEIQELYIRKTQKLQEFAKYKALSKIGEVDIDFTAFITSLQEAAIGEYMAGYNIGRDKMLEQKEDSAALMESIRKKLIGDNYNNW